MLDMVQNIGFFVNEGLVNNVKVYN